jgi:phosphoenolpyruvate-protein kinase (PTS system EI component)
MTPSSIPAVRRAIRSVSAADLKTVAVSALADRSAADARARFAHLARDAS